MRSIVAVFLLLMQGIAAQNAPVFEPLFSSVGVQASVRERSPEGTAVLTVGARGSFGETIVFGISLSAADMGVFVINSSTGNITVGQNGSSRLVTRNNAVTSFTFEVFAYYSSVGPAGDRAYLRVTVDVVDVNDPPRFADQQETIAVTEGSPVGFVVHRFIAMDDDLSSNGAITYSLQQIAPAMNGPDFVIRAFTGDLVIAQSLDIGQLYQLRTIVTDEGIPPLNASLSVTVRVDPEPPVFNQPIYTATVPEFTGEAPVAVVTVLARDSNPQNPPRSINYAIGSFSPANGDVMFNISRTSGVLTVSGTLDRETVSRFIISVKAYVQGHHPDSAAVATVVMQVNDVNEPPEFLRSHYSIAVSEGAQPGEILSAGIVAVDQDMGSGGQLSYSVAAIEALQTLDGMRVVITKPFFTIDPRSAVIIVNTSLEREEEIEGFHYYELTVVATDGGNPPLSSNTSIIVTVTDINDNPPEFINSSYIFLLPENEPLGTVIGQFTAEDRDTGPAANLTFSVTGPFAERFRVEVVSVILPTTSLTAQPPVVTTGRLVAQVSLDREERDMYFLTIVAHDVTTQPLNASIPVVVAVLDMNDNAPEFASANFSFMVPEDGFPNAALVANFDVIDMDSGQNAEVDFSLEAGPARQFFSLLHSDSSSTQLHLARELDRETQDFYSFRIFATDRGSPSSLIGQTEIFITVGDVNDNPPIFNQSTYTAVLVENTPAGTSVTTVRATDADIGTNAQVAYRLLDEPPSLLDVHNQTGEIFLIASPDFETTISFTARVMAADRGTPQEMVGTAVVVVTIMDENDNAPVFQSDNYTVSVPESVTVDGEITRVVATDADSGSSGQVMYCILSGNEAGLFRIDETTGTITAASTLDREATPEYTLIVMATDRGQPPQSSETILTILVADVNDNSPQFLGEPYVTQLSEGFNGSVGASVFRIPVTDLDEGTNAEIQYSLSGNGADHFTIDSSGEVQVSSLGVDYEAVFDTPYVLIVTAMDQGSPAMINTSTINITLTDANDNRPIFSGAPYLVTIPEGTRGPQVVLTVVATDEDTSTNGQIEYFTAGGTVGDFRIDTNTGNITLAPGALLDREVDALPHDENGNAVYTFGVTAVDKGTPAQLNYATASILVSDINDNAPEFLAESYSVQVSEGLSIGTPVLNLLAIDDDFGSNAEVVYSIASQQPALGYFAIDHMTGVLSVAASLDRELQEIVTLNITATDQGPGNNQANVTVWINITGSNDNQPVFTIPPGGYVANISENATVGSFVITVEATDRDVGRHGQITYAIMDNNTFVPFEIADPTVGHVTVSGPLDREQTAEYRLIVVATDSAATQEEVLQAFATVQVVIEDVNDNTPVFSSSSYSGIVQENTELGTTVLTTPTISASDPDSGTAAELTYSLIGPGSEAFSIDNSTGTVTTATSLDREMTGVYPDLVLIVMDGGGRESNASLEITITDTNDHSPVFSPDDLNFTITEDISTGAELTIVSATDRDQGSNALLTYSLSGENLSGEFTIDAISGAITINRGLDYELRQEYLLNITGADGGTPQREGYLTITVNVQDANDNSPNFTNPRPTFNVTENSEVGTLVGFILATDRDSGTNGEIVYEFVSPVGGKFSIDSQSGAITTNDTIDREERSSYSLLVQARDSATFPLVTHTDVTIVVDDVNDIQPFFPASPAVYTISENTAVGSPVVSLTAVDGDLGTNAELTYFGMMSVPAVNFNVNSSTGLITTSQPLDREMIASYNITIAAIDGGTPPLTGVGTVIINISDENDNAPSFTEASYETTIPENSMNGSFVAALLASDEDSGSNGQVSYSIIGGLTAFEIDSTSGMVTVRNSTALDFETTQIIHVQIEAQDMGTLRLSTQTLLVVHLADVNDNAPQFTSLPGNPEVSENAMIGSIVQVVDVADADQGTNAQLTYTIIGGSGQGKFSILRDGTITVREALDYETDFQYSLIIEAADGGFPSLMSTATVTIVITDVNDNPPVFTNPDVPILIAEDTEIGTPFGGISAFDADSGDNGLYVFSIVATGETVPFTIDDSSGVLQVTGPLDRETVPQYLVLIEVRDNGNPPLSTQREFTITVTDVDDNLPEFITPPEFTIFENQSTQTPFGILTTTDRDIGNNSEAFYYIVGGGSASLFGVNAKFGTVFLMSPVDYETQTQHTVQIAAKSVDAPPRNDCTALTCTVVNMTVFVQDINDNGPIWSQPVYDFGVDEDAPAGTGVGTVLATDADSGSFGIVDYSLLTGTTNFTINRDSGILTLSRPYNKTSGSRIVRLTVAATDRAGGFSENVAVRVYHITRENLVVLTVSQPMADVTARLDELRSTLATIREAVIVVYTVESGTATPARQARQAGTSPMTNITLFSANLTSNVLLSSSELLRLIDNNIDQIGQTVTVESVMVYPVPTTVPPSGLDTQLTLYIVIGVLGGLIVLSFFLFFFICCCVMWRRKHTRRKFRPTYKTQPKSTDSSVNAYAMPDAGSLENPLWVNPYSNWSEEPQSPSVTFTYKPHASEKLNRDSTEIRESALYESEEYLMEHFSESEDSADEEATVQLKQDGAEFSRGGANEKGHEPVKSEEEEDDSDDIPLVTAELDISFQPEEEDSTTSEEEEEHKGDPVDKQQEDEEPPEIDAPLDFMDQDDDQLLEAAEEDGSPDPLMF